jgi:hypothetical protein
MRLQSSPINYLPAWADLNDVQFNGISVSSMPDDRGTCIIATAELSTPDEILMTVPQGLILSLENVWIYAKSDRHLREVLEAVGEYSRVASPSAPPRPMVVRIEADIQQTARGAILVFLLLQLTHVNHTNRIGRSNPFTHYIQFLPSGTFLPTFWNSAQRARLKGTSLDAALNAKLKSLEREFDMLREATTPIDWCRQHWWDPEAGWLCLEHWKYVDAMYRSRALDLLGTDAMVPCIDMANHASGRDTLARYDLDADGNAILVLLAGRTCRPGEEISITYGDAKGACEMLFSYGFIEHTMCSARELYLDLDIPSDDPLKLAKQAVAHCAPGFRLFTEGEAVGWEGPWVWLVCVNEEDGLKFRLLRTHDEERELRLLWQDVEIDSVSQLEPLLRTQPLWEVFQLRAITLLQARVKLQLMSLQNDPSHSPGEGISDHEIEAGGRDLAITRLRDLEGTLMLQAYDDFESQVYRTSRPLQDPGPLISSWPEIEVARIRSRTALFRIC